MVDILPIREQRGIDERATVARRRGSPSFINPDDIPRLSGTLDVADAIINKLANWECFCAHRPPVDPYLTCLSCEARAYLSERKR